VETRLNQAHLRGIVRLPCVELNVRTTMAGAKRLCCVQALGSSSAVNSNSESGCITCKIGQSLM
jgi:hypothetical protein